MNKAEWDALNTSEKNILVAKNVMGLTVFEFEPGTNSRLFCAVPPEEIDNPEYFDEFLKRYTTNRNACALVLDEIYAMGPETEEAFGDKIRGIHFGSKDVRWGSRIAETRILRLSPDLICYCAIKAIE